MAIAVPKHEDAHRCALRGAGARLPRLPRVRARPRPQHARRLPHRPAPVRRLPRGARARRGRRSSAPTSPTSSPTWRPGRPGRATATAGAPPCSPATISRKTACLRSFYRHLRREELIADDPTATLSPPREEPQAAARAQPGRGDEAARAARGAPIRSSCATARCSRSCTGAGCGPRRRSGSRSATSTCAAASSARTARARRSGSCRSAARPRRAIERYLRSGRPELVGERRRAQAVRQLPRRRADPPGPLQDHPAPREGGRARAAR